MTNVSLKTPVCLNMEILEIEDKYYPSFRMKINLLVNHFTGEYIYSADDIWFRNSDWDNFQVSINNISSYNAPQAVLTDLSGYFSIVITIKNLDLYLKIICKEPIVEFGYPTFITLDIEKKISTEDCFLIYNAFCNDD